MTKSKIDDLGFLELSPGTDPVVDIVAIHGLDGHREKTWVTKDGILWLRDFLRLDLPNARILSYGYDADTQSRECVSTQTMRRHAEGLAQALSRQRLGAPRRPIIFVAHNLGGIILKWALVICHNQNLESKADLRDLLVSTHATLFFGTPHSGLEGTSLFAVINHLAALYTKTTNIILKDLCDHSSELENVQTLFVAVSEKISSIFFCEGYQTPTDRTGMKMNVPYHSAVVAGDRNATTIVLNATHEDLVRFPTADCANYRIILHYLKEYFDSAARGESAAREVLRPKLLPPLSISYIERPKLQSLITQKLLHHGNVWRQPRCILHGLGGSGKTQLATRWIRENRSSFTQVIVVDASSQAQLEVDLERSIRSLGTEYHSMTWKDAVSYLDSKEERWLLFIDNADSPGLNLHSYLPSSTHGAVLITTRNRQCIGYAPHSAIPVGGLEEGQAVNLLHMIMNVTPMSDTGLVGIVKEVGMLALAVTQAGAHICNTLRPDRYLNTFRKYRKRLLRKAPDVVTHYPSSTYTTFDLSFHRLPTKTQEFMKVCAFLHHSIIPSALFEQSIESGFTTRMILNSCPPPASDKTLTSMLGSIFGLEWDELAFQETIDSASTASLIDVSLDGLFYTINPLLQTYIKDGLDEEGSLTYTRMTAQLLLGAIGSNNIQAWTLLPHVNKIPLSVQSDDIAHALAFNLFYSSLREWRVCQELLEPALSKLLDAQGPRHEDSIWLMAALARTLHMLGQLERAEKMQREILALRLEILGRLHPDTIWAMNDLANTLQQHGRLDKAERMQREVLALRLEVHGQRNLDTVSVMHDLALTLYNRNELEEAESMQREAL
ncbi:related to kinesin light chain, partial [Serendipita indica DSM 11827]